MCFCCYVINWFLVSFLLFLHPIFYIVSVSRYSGQGQLVRSVWFDQSYTLIRILPLNNFDNMSSYHCPDNKTLQTLRDIANKLRVHSIEATDASNSGWVTWSFQLIIGNANKWEGIDNYVYCLCICSSNFHCCCVSNR